MLNYVTTNPSDLVKLLESYHKTSEYLAYTYVWLSILNQEGSMDYWER